jgi:hypothetical protein
MQLASAPCSNKSRTHPMWLYAAAFDSGVSSLASATTTARNEAMSLCAHAGSHCLYAYARVPLVLGIDIGTSSQQQLETLLVALARC